MPTAVCISPNPTARRLSGGRRLSGFNKEEVADFFDENDDEQERAAMAAAAQKKKMKPKSPFKETPGHKKRVDMYKDCIGLVNDNRDRGEHRVVSV